MKPTLTLKVRIKAVQKKPGRRRPYGVRWHTDWKEHSEWFPTKPLAERRRSDLMQATRQGEAFDIESGLPESELAKRDSRSLLTLSQNFIDAEWEGHTANTRA